MYLINNAIVIALIFPNILIQGNLLIYSSREIIIPALETIDKHNFENYLRNNLKNPKVVAFNYQNIEKTVLDVLNKKHSCYVPSANIDFENATVLVGNTEKDKITINKVLSNIKNNEDIVIALTPLKKRFERGIKEPLPTELPTSVDIIEPTGPVLFNASLKNVETMIYSSKPPLLIINTTTLNLGNPKSSSIDSRESYVRLIVTIQINDGPEKVALRFKFPWTSGYWSLASVIVEKDTKTYNLSIMNDVNAPRKFSYHCGGETVFKNEELDAKLILYNIQAQPDAKNSKFSDAYNCVPFTTVPIWSGLFVIFMLIIGLFIGLDALWSIKTMDKFDNYRTKQLTITVTE